MNPVFIFGTGRCGSTHLQRLITLSTSTWIWGEHEGMLGPIMDAVRNAERSEILNREIFERRDSFDDQQLIKQMRIGSHYLSWLNRFGREALRREVAILLNRLFGSEIPEGWSEWGFKEILYGLNNDVPDILVDVFPGASMAFTFRDPGATVSSMIRTWSPELCRNEELKNDLAEMVRLRAQRYEKILTYFLDLRQQRNRKIVFVSTQALNSRPEVILDALGLSGRVKSIAALEEKTNQGAREEAPGWAQEVIDANYEAFHPRLEALYRRSLEISRLDFPEPAHEPSAPQ